MAEIVYFVGAGFSAPAGLPVIADFLFKAKNQYFKQPEDFAYFKSVFSYIDGLSKGKNFTDIDLSNVEEVFSIADTHELLGQGKKKELQDFIKDVVSHHTPDFERHLGGFDLSHGSFEILLGSSDCMRKYVSFVATVLGIEFAGTRTDNPDTLDYDDLVAVQGEAPNNYKFISLNYDTILENAVDFINTNFSGTFPISIAKLHGSVSGEIVPPTWNKKLDGTIGAAWAEAAKWLANASEIRILGYSLPQTDINVKHLFSAALMESHNLQYIDVLCLDPDGSVKTRFDNMFTFPRYRFHSVNLDDYLGCFGGRGNTRSPFRTHSRNTENSHEDGLRQY